MNKVFLPKKYVYIQDAVERWNSNPEDGPNPGVPPSSEPLNFNSWELTDSGVRENMTLQLDLESPIITKAIISEDYIQLVGSAMVESGVISDDFHVVVYQQDNPENKTLYVVACYNSDNTSGEPNEECPFNISIPSCGAVAGTELEMYLFKDDPRTSRGTVTTVQYEKDDVVNQVK